MARDGVESEAGSGGDRSCKTRFGRLHSWSKLAFGGGQKVGWWMVGGEGRAPGWACWAWLAPVLGLRAPPAAHLVAIFSGCPAKSTRGCGSVEALASILDMHQVPTLQGLNLQPP